MIPLWKVRREFRRLGEQIRTLGRRIAAPHARRRHDAGKPGNLQLTEGSVPPGAKVALYLVYQPKGLLASSLATLDHLVAKGYAPLVVANAPLSGADRAAVAARAWMIMERPNFGYDFGGYRDGILWLLDRGQALDHLLVLNDSVWFPLSAASHEIDRMEAAPEPLFGPVHSDHPRGEGGNICSFLFRYRGVICADPRFRALWQNLPVSDDKGLTVRLCEMSLSQSVQALGYKVGYDVDPAAHLRLLEGLPPSDLRSIIAYQSQMDPSSADQLVKALAQPDGPLLWTAYCQAFARRHSLRYVPLAHPRVLLVAMGLGFLKKERATRFAIQRRELFLLGLHKDFDPVMADEIRRWDQT